MRRTNDYGFLETPYRKVVGGKVTDDIEYMSAINEADYVIAQASAIRGQERASCRKSLVSVRYQGEFSLKSPDESPLHGCFSAASCFCSCGTDTISRA